MSPIKKTNVGMFVTAERGNATTVPFVAYEIQQVLSTTQ